MNTFAHGLTDEELLAKSTLTQAKQHIGKSTLSGYLNNAGRHETLNDTMMMHGKVYKFLQSTALFFKQEIHLNSESTFALAILLAAGRHHSQY
ncbi:hypothetical protein VINI7043_16001 [Vibrio nigripulchritudo ATCC 27043]|nr:hypothetical protein VINI7043_16001 [Vibrio nigripulchritudo ATCC 27043]